MKLEAALLYMLSNERPYNGMHMFRARAVAPLLWLQDRYPDLPLAQLRCPSGALQAFARRHPDAVRAHVAQPGPLPWAQDLAAYLDSCEAGAAIERALGARL